MIQAILGRKTDQSHKFLKDGTRIPVTEISVPDNAVFRVKTLEKDKYTAVQIGLGKKKNFSKSALGISKKAGFDFVPQIVTEIKYEGDSSFSPGNFIKAMDVLKPGDIVDVRGFSKGKGFAGVVKRHGFRGGPKTHGQSDRLRAPGSIGQTTTPGRVYKGKRMAGHAGHEIVTIKNLKVVLVDDVNKKLFVTGLVPGVKGSVLRITRSGEVKKFVPLIDAEEFEKKKPDQESAIAGAVENSSAEQKAKQDKAIETAVQKEDAKKEDAIAVEVEEAEKAEAKPEKKVSDKKQK